MFKPGDVVKLKTEGPKMTVSYIDGAGTVTCQWFVDSNLKQGSFLPGTLQLAT